MPHQQVLLVEGLGRAKAYGHEHRQIKAHLTASAGVDKSDASRPIFSYVVRIVLG